MFAQRNNKIYIPWDVCLCVWSGDGCIIIVEETIYNKKRLMGCHIIRKRDEDDVKKIMSFFYVISHALCFTILHSILDIFFDGVDYFFLILHKFLQTVKYSKLFNSHSIRLRMFLQMLK